MLLKVWTTVLSPLNQSFVRSSTWLNPHIDDFHLVLSLLQFNSTKLQLIEAEKQKIKREYERKEGTIEVKKKVTQEKAMLPALVS